MSTIEIDQWTRAGHERFKKAQRFTVVIGDTTAVLSWSEWMDWQASRDPLADEVTAASHLLSFQKRGPGIARRKPVKKAAAHKPKNASDKK